MADNELTTTDSAAADHGSVVCSNCEEEVQEAHRFCPYCGELFEGQRSLHGLIRGWAVPLVVVLAVISALLLFFFIFPLRDQTGAIAGWERYWQQQDQEQQVNDFSDYLPPRDYLKGKVDGITILAPEPLYRNLLRALLILKLNAPNHYRMIAAHVENIHYLPHDKLSYGQGRFQKAGGSYLQESKTVLLFRETVHFDHWLLAEIIAHEAAHGYFASSDHDGYDDPRYIAEQVACEQFGLETIRPFAPTATQQIVNLGIAHMNQVLAGRAPVPPLPVRVCK